MNIPSTVSALRHAGHIINFIDGYVEWHNIERLSKYDTIIFPVPFFDGLNSAIKLFKQLD